jgi:hypothetical protein
MYSPLAHWRYGPVGRYLGTYAPRSLALYSAVTAAAHIYFRHRILQTNKDHCIKPRSNPPFLIPLMNIYFPSTPNSNTPPLHYDVVQHEIALRQPCGHRLATA